MKKTLSHMALLATLSVSTFALAGQTVATTNQKLSVLFIQEAAGGSLTALEGKPGYYQLELNGVKDYTGYFSDRPARISGIYPMTKFITNWQDNSSPDSFKKVPPNAALSTVVQDGHTKKLVNVPVQLSSPSYDANKQTIRYTVQVLPGIKAPLPLKNMGQTELFIDAYCVSCAG